MDLWKRTSGRIIKATGIFSGVRVVNILCSLVRNKLIAYFIGPAGLGLVIIYNSILELIGQTSRLSIDQSAQRDISQSSASQVDTTVAVVRKWSLWLGLCGAAVTCLASPLLSLWSFGTPDRWLVFCLLSVVPFCTTYSACVNAENQGLRRFKALAFSNLTGSITGLAIAVPLILCLGLKSIAWIIFAYGLALWGGSYLFRPKVRKVALSRTEVIDKGKSFIKLGAQITFATFVTQSFAYAFILFLNIYTSTDTLGLFQAGYTMMNSYVGIVFSALWVEYYPRLSSHAHSRKRTSMAVSHQVVFTLICLTPLLCLLILLVKPVICLVYSDRFLDVTPYIVIACAGVVLRAVSWCQAYVLLASGGGKHYIYTEIVSSMVGFAFNILGYCLAGFLGLGVAYVCWYLFYAIIIAWVCRNRYGVTYNRRAYITIAGALIVVGTVAVLKVCCN